MLIDFLSKEFVEMVKMTNSKFNFGGTDIDTEVIKANRDVIQAVGDVFEAIS